MKEACLGFACLFLFAEAVSAQDWAPPDMVIAATHELVAPAVSTGRALRGERGPLSAALVTLLDQEYAGNHADDLVPIRIVLTGNLPDTVPAILERLGGVFESVWEDAVYARLPARQIRRLPQVLGGIRGIERQATVAAQTLTSSPGIPEGPLPEALRALQQNSRGGRGMRIGILDFGFSGYAVAGLPTPVATRSFSRQSRVFGGSAHGTACARLIHRVAPEASLILASVGDGANAGEGEVLAAAQWLADQGAQLVNVSASGYVSALDGSAPLDRLIDHLSNRGSTWVVAAGNQAQTHWRGVIADANHDGWVDLGIPSHGDLLVFEVTQPGSVAITLNWTPWDNHGADLDAFLYGVHADGRPELLAQADTVQPSGRVRPVETLTRQLPAGFYLLGIRATRLEHAGVVNVFISGAAHMSPALSAGSVGSPGTAAGAVTVGMADGERSAVFSARGPTEDGRSKPEILAPGMSKEFTGTSAAAPVVTGIAALWQARDPDLKGVRLAAAFRRASLLAQDASAVWGVIDLSAVAYK